MENNNIDIMPDICLDDLFSKFPELEDKIISLVPALTVLRNQSLRKNILPVTTLKQAAVIGKLNLGEFINTLRKEANLPEFEYKTENTEGLPEWLKEENIVLTYDAIDDLAKGLHPVGKVLSESANLKIGEIYLLITNFVPAPLLKKAEEAGLKVFSRELSPNKFGSYFCK